MPSLDFSEEEFTKLINTANFYAFAKRLLLIGEQVDPEGRTLLQPINEFRNSYDHLMRVIAVKLGIKTTTDTNYIETNLDKAYGHVYRAAYDAMDWVSLTLKSRFIDELSQFSLTTISLVLPNYHTEIKPRIEQIFAEEIPNLRVAKDVGSSDASNIDKYAELLEEIRNYYYQVVSAKSGLIEAEKQIKKSKRKVYIYRVILSIISACIGAFIAYLIM